MKKQKRQTSERVVSARILAGLALAGLVVMYMHDKSQTDIGSAFGVFYESVLITIIVIIWLALEVNRHIKK